MSLRRLSIVGTVAAAAAAVLAASGSASAEGWVFHANYRQEVTGEIYNICDLSQGPDSPRFTIANGSFQQQATIVQVADLHFNVSMHSVTQLIGAYPDGTHVTVNSTFNATEHVNVDPSSLETGILVLDSALTATYTEHDMINVQGQNGAPDKHYDGVIHLTYTPNLQLASVVVEYRGGCV
jgi:hypothetical protein